MKLPDFKIPFWIIIIIEVISFMVFIFPNLSDFSSVAIQIPILIIQVLIFVPLLFKLDKKWFVYIWISLFYFYFLFKILFDFEETFIVQNPETNAIITISGLLSFIYILISAGFIFGEKSVKPILVTLSSTTTFAVLLIVIFISKEGYLAFVENDPVNFIIGDEWEANYSSPTKDEKIITIYIDDYNFDIVPIDDQIFVSPNINATVEWNISNIGSYPDEYLITDSSSSSVSTELSTETISLTPGDSYVLKMNITPNIKGSYELKIAISSKNSNISKENSINCVVGEKGIDLTPEYSFLDLEGYAVGNAIDMKIINLGLMDEEITAEVEYPPFFRPSLIGEGFEWDYSKNYVNFTLEKNSTMDIRLLPRIIELDRNTHVINVTVRSIENPNVFDTASLIVEYSTRDYLNMDRYEQTIGPGKESSFYANISIYTSNTEGDLVIQEQGTDDLEFELIFENETVPITNGIAKVGLNNSKNTTLEIRVKVKDDASMGNPRTIKITFKDKGGDPTYAIGPFIVGTFYTTIIALIIAVPLGLGSAIFLAEYCPNRIRKILRPLYELLAGIPSVIYGLWGFIAFGPYLVDKIFPMIDGSLGLIFPIFRITSRTPPLGGVILTAGLILAIMILPYIITLSEDAIRAVPRGLLEGSIALGTTRWQTIRGVILKKARSGIIASIILAMGRAIGETMAVVMVLGFVTGYPSSLLEPGSSMTAVIAGTFGWAFDQEYTRHAIFGIAIVLFIMVFILNIIVYRIHTKASSNDGIYNKIGRQIGKNWNKKTRIMIKSNISVKELKQKYIKPRRLHINEWIIKSIFVLFASIVVLSLLLVLTDVIINGGGSLKLNYLFEKEIAGGIGGSGGFANAIVGSVILTAFALIIAAPMSIGAAIYVTQYTHKSNLFTRSILFTSDTLASTPSIVFGAFGFVFFVMELNFKVSMLAGGLTLGIMVIPLLLRSSIEALNSIPSTFRDASLALGASKWQTVWKVILPPAMGGITSGVILSIGRAIGETAAIIFTAGYAFGYTQSLMQPVATMPSMIFSYYEMSGTDPILESKVYSAAFVLILLVLVLNSIARIFQWRSNNMMKGR
jgi:phosphate transport system permease protein